MAIAVISTGGTIASVDDSGREASPELHSDDLVASVPGLAAETDLVTDDFATTVSHHHTVDWMAGLLARIEAHAADADVDGIVVTQGTNTLETVSYFVDLCYDGDVPVVFTGAMRNPSLVSPDGPGNLLTAVRAAASPRASEMGVLVAFDFRLHAARDVTKVHTQNPDSFRSPAFGPVVAMAEGTVRWRRRPLDPEPTFDPDRDALTNDVPIVPLAADIPTTTLEAAADSTAVCLVTLGPGHLTPAVIPVLEAFRSSGPPVVATTWCPEGALARDTYECHGCENTTRRLCHYSDLNPRKTRIKAIVASAADRFEEAFVPPES
ncbi:MAG: asparaginase [Haloarculaceae archaeon]